MYIMILVEDFIAFVRGRIVGKSSCEDLCVSASSCRPSNCDINTCLLLYFSGGRIVGKSSCEDLCVSAASCSNHLGPVRNPTRSDWSAGGSSSGNAVLVSLEILQ